MIIIKNIYIFFKAKVLAFTLVVLNDVINYKLATDFLFNFISWILFLNHVSIFLKNKKLSHLLQWLLQKHIKKIKTREV